MAIIGTVKLVGYNFTPRGYAECSGQLLAIASNPSLFSLLGTTYGGDGRNTFGLPDVGVRKIKIEMPWKLPDKEGNCMINLSLLRMTLSKLVII